MRKISTTAVAMLAIAAFAGHARAADDKKKGSKDGEKPADDESKPAAGSAMPMPDPDPTFLAAAKKMVGNWKCKGNGYAPDGTAMPTTATMKYSLDLDKMWLKGQLTIPKSKGMKRAMKDTSYRTYSAQDKKWYEVSVSNMGGWSSATSSGPDAGGKTEWDVTTNMFGQTFSAHDYEEPGTKKNTMHIWGEVSMDGGKSFVKEFDVTCSK